MPDDYAPQPGASLNMSEPIAFVLTLGQWDVILRMLAQQPWETADPMIRSLRAQLTGVLKQRDATRIPGNGAQPHTVPVSQ